jgi:predicted SprT family Zn-dependent metalloprotease
VLFHFPLLGYRRGLYVFQDKTRFKTNLSDWKIKVETVGKILCKTCLRFDCSKIVDGMFLSCHCNNYLIIQRRIQYFNRMKCFSSGTIFNLVSTACTRCSNDCIINAITNRWKQNQLSNFH